jgi:hypothetical protein
VRSKDFNALPSVKVRFIEPMYARLIVPKNWLGQFDPALIMSGESSNALGARGEALFLTIMTSFHGAMPLFRVHFLGEKWPIVDFVCELEGTWQRHRPFFFVQVKATRRGYTAGGRLRVSVTKPKAIGLARFKAPVYLVGIDEVNEQAYIVGAAGPRVGALTSLHCGTALDSAGRSGKTYAGIGLRRDDSETGPD